MHKLPWSQGITFGAICDSYAKLVNRVYGRPVVVFDGYSQGPSTKDTAHDRRTKGLHGTRVLFNNKTPFKSKKDVFLSNTDNKQDFIQLLSTHLEEIGCRVIHAKSDADLMIVQAAVEESKLGPTAVVGEDTDLLILLCFHADIRRNTIFLKSDVKAGMKKKKVWNINHMKETLGCEMCRMLPLVHAFTGSDTTSRLYGIGKGSLLKKLMSDTALRPHAELFLNPKATHSEIEAAGEELFKALYGGRPEENLDSLRYRKFISKVVSNTTVVQVQTLPPTHAAAVFHSYRVFQQVQTWIGEVCDPLKWGWFTDGKKMMPCKTSLPPAPERLLNVIKCNCKTNCDTKRCTCRKHGLLCAAGCGECRGICCSNASSFPLIEEAEEAEDAEDAENQT